MDANIDGRQFVQAVMRKVGAANPTELSKMLGDPWTDRDQQRKLYKWAAGETQPNFAGTMALLSLAGMLTDRRAVPRRPTALEARMRGLEERQAQIVEALGQLVAAVDDLKAMLKKPARAGGASPRTRAG